MMRGRSPSSVISLDGSLASSTDSFQSDSVPSRQDSNDDNFETIGAHRELSTEVEASPSNSNLGLDADDTPADSIIINGVVYHRANGPMADFKTASSVSPAEEELSVNRRSSVGAESQSEENPSEEAEAEAEANSEPEPTSEPKPEPTVVSPKTETSTAHIWPTTLNWRPLNFAGFPVTSPAVHAAIPDPPPREDTAIQTDRHSAQAPVTVETKFAPRLGNQGVPYFDPHLASFKDSFLSTSPVEVHFSLEHGTPVFLKTYIHLKVLLRMLRHESFEEQRDAACRKEVIALAGPHASLGDLVNYFYLKVIEGSYSCPTSMLSRVGLSNVCSLYVWASRLHDQKLKIDILDEIKALSAVHPVQNLLTQFNNVYEDHYGAVDTQLEAVIEEVIPLSFHKTRSGALDVDGETYSDDVGKIIRSYSREPGFFGRRISNILVDMLINSGKNDSYRWKDCLIDEKEGINKPSADMDDSPGEPHGGHEQQHMRRVEIGKAVQQPPISTADHSNDVQAQSTIHSVEEKAREKAADSPRKSPAITSSYNKCEQVLSQLSVRYCETPRLVKDVPLFFSAKSQFHKAPIYLGCHFWEAGRLARAKCTQRRSERGLTFNEGDIITAISAYGHWYCPESRGTVRIFEGTCRDKRGPFEGSDVDFAREFPPVVHEAPKGMCSLSAGRPSVLTFAPVEGWPTR